MHLATRKARLQLLAILLLCLVVVVPLVGASIFASVAAAHGGPAAVAAQQVQAQRRHDDAARKAGVHVAANLLKTLSHLRGLLLPASLSKLLLEVLVGTIAAVVACPPLWELVFAIYHPPKRRTRLAFR